MAGQLIQEAFLMPKQETALTLKPADSSAPGNEAMGVLARVPLNIDSYEWPPDKATGKTKVLIAGNPAPDFGRDGYVFQGHFEPFDLFLHVARDTGLKQDPAISLSKTDDSKRLLLAQGSSLALLDLDEEIRHGCLRVRLKNEHGGYTEWWANADPSDSNNDGNPDGACRIIGQVIEAKPNIPTRNNEQVPVKPVRDRGRKYRCPGYKDPHTGVWIDYFWTGYRIIPNGNFSWAEATNGGTRIPTNGNVIKNIIRIARVMDEVRKQVGGRSITVNSWYRDPVSNRRCGGASQSRHLQGDAVDFVVQGMHPYDVNRKLNGWWGGRGGLASASVFTHIDARGWGSRWSYGF